MTVTVFLKNEVLARGRPEEVVPAMRALQPLARSSDLLAFDDESGRQVDLDLRPGAAPPAPSSRAPRAWRRRQRKSPCCRAIGIGCRASAAALRRPCAGWSRRRCARAVRPRMT